MDTKHLLYICVRNQVIINQMLLRLYSDLVLKACLMMKTDTLLSRSKQKESLSPSINLTKFEIVIIKNVTEFLAHLYKRCYMSLIIRARCPL
jgi:hypothetical protein